MPPPIVEGRVSEAGGAGAAFAQVTLAQGDHLQVVRTRPDGWFRFRAFEGAGTLTVKLPQGWTAEALTREVGPALRGDVIRADFLATARRVLRGRLLVAGAPLPEVRLSAGPADRTDGAARGPGRARPGVPSRDGCAFTGGGQRCAGGGHAATVSDGTGAGAAGEGPFRGRRIHEARAPGATPDADRGAPVT